MAKPSPHVVCDNCVYNHAQLAVTLGRAERWTKDFVRAHVPHVDGGNGLLIVSGYLFRLAIEQGSTFPEGDRPKRTGRGRNVKPD